MRLGEASGLVQGQIWITERYEQYVVGPRDLDAEREALVTIMTRAKRNRVGTFSASGTGTCLRKRQFQYLGYPQTHRNAIKTHKIFMNGDYMHLRYQVAGLVGGWLRSAEVLYTEPELKLVGTVDGINVEDDLVEFKSINSHGFAKILLFGPDPKHVHQIQTYLFLTGADRCWLLYENKDTQDTKEFCVDRDETDIASIVAVAQRLVEASDNHELLPMRDDCSRREGQFLWCEYAASCPTATWHTRPTSSSVTG